MKQTILFFITFLSLNLQAQFKKNHKEKIRAYKIAFLTEKLDLSENEAEKFWPIYKAYSKKMIELRKEEHFEIRKKIQQAGGLGAISEKEAEKIMTRIKEINKERYQSKNIFYKKMATVLPLKKLLILEFSEFEFNRRLLRKLRKNKTKKGS